MPRRSAKVGGTLIPTFGDSDTELSSEDFHSPEELENATDYGLEYTGRIVNPYGPSTSRDAAKLVPKKQPTARKKTNKTPVQHQRTPAMQLRRTPAVQRQQTPISPHQRAPVASYTTRSSTEPERQIAAGRRKQRKPLRNRTMYQLMKSADFLVPRLPFGRLIQEIIINTSRDTEVSRISKVALEALQESAEMYLVQQLQDAYTLTLHRGQVTLKVKDMEVLRFLRGNF